MSYCRQKEARTRIETHPGRLNDTFGYLFFLAADFLAAGFFFAAFLAAGFFAAVFFFAGAFFFAVAINKSP